MATLYWPFDPSRINYGYGYPPGYGGYHNGIDFPVPQGTELRATASGTVRNVDAGTVDGAGVDIITAEGWKVRMWHVSAFLVANGSQVEAGQVVALSGGARGTWGAGNSTGAHLHWGVATDGRNGWVDPANLNPIPFGQPKPPQPTPSKGKIAMIVKVQCLHDGWAAVWNMNTGEFQHIDDEGEWTYWTEHLQEYMFENYEHFIRIRDKYRKVFSDNA